MNAMDCTLILRMKTNINSFMDSLDLALVVDQLATWGQSKWLVIKYSRLNDDQG